MLTVEQLGRISLNPDWETYDLAGDVKALVPEMRAGAITTKKRVAAFLGNCCVETDRLKTLEEYGGKSYWLYLDRMSGRSGEWVYHGRGYLMNTWREAYERLSRALGVDLVADPGLLIRDKTLAAKAAVWYWTQHELNWYADHDRYKDVCDIINTGNEWGNTNHWPERLQHYNLAMGILPDDFDLGKINAPPREVIVPGPKKISIAPPFADEKTAMLVVDEMREDVDLPSGKTVVIRKSDKGSLVAIPQVFTSQKTVERVASEIELKVKLPEGKRVLVRPAPGGPVKEPEPQDLAPQKNPKKKVAIPGADDWDDFISYIRPAVDRARYWIWKAGIIPDGPGAYAINRVALPSIQTIVDGGIFCAGVGNLGQRSIGKRIPTKGDPALDGGVAAYWTGRYGRGYYSDFARPFDIRVAKNWANETGIGVLIGTGYWGADLNSQGHVAYLMPEYKGKNYVLQSWLSYPNGKGGLNWDYTIEQSHSGGYYDFMCHPDDHWAYRGDEIAA